MKKVLIVIISVISAISIYSCSKEMVAENDCFVKDSFSGQKAFAEVLSKAVSENQSLRLFIQETALEQFDCDYDVFYPFVKDKEVENGKTFREILLNYTDEETLSAIERENPKLNILVPDWEWMGCFSVNSWDASAPGLAVSYVAQSGDIELFDNGEFVGKLPDGCFPDFPVLIIKSNERMVVSPSTRGGDIQYDFLDEAFNNAITRVEHQYSHPTVDGDPDVSNFVPASEINYRAKQAYEYFPKGARSIYQRDYLYYGMTGEGQEKPRYDNVWETIYKFKFDKFDIPSLFDDKVNGTVYDLNKEKMLSHVEDYKKNDSAMSAAKLRSAFYAEGNLELMFLINIPTNGTKEFMTTKSKSVSFKDVFAISYVDLDFRHRTWFVRDWYVYTLDINAIKPKWCMLNWMLPSWDISEDSGLITIVVSEFDETGSKEMSYSTKKTVARNFKVDLSGEGDFTIFGQEVKLKLGLGYNKTTTTEDATTEKYVRNQGGIDKLGQAELEYLHPVLENKTTKNGVSGYEVHTITTGSVDLMILPTCY